MSLAQEPLFRRGVELFNARRFFECHEVLEELWRPAHGPERLFLQAVIHFAVAYHHHLQGNPSGARTQLRKALRKLAGYLPRFENVDTAALYRLGQQHLEAIERGCTIQDFATIPSS